MFNQQPKLGRLPLVAGVWTWGRRGCSADMFVCITRCPGDVKHRCPLAFFFFKLVWDFIPVGSQFGPPISCFTDASFVPCTVKFFAEVLTRGFCREGVRCKRKDRTGL